MSASSSGSSPEVSALLLDESAKGELDDDSLEVLFEQLVKEIDVLDDFEDEVASVDVGH